MAAALTQQKTAQEIIDLFWKTHTPPQAPSKASSVLPRNVYAHRVSQNVPSGEVSGQSVEASYKQAVRQCEAKVAQIVAECRLHNQKYSDPHFELSVGAVDPLHSLTAVPPDQSNDANPSQNTAVTYQVTQTTSGPGPITWGTIQPDGPRPAETDTYDGGPPSVKRVGAIFDDPKFFVVGGAKTTDTRQGAEGDCWFISALGSLCTDTGFKHLIEKVCPENARDEQVGVYGFVFHRDGEWISEIIDDKLYLRKPDFDDWVGDDRDNWVNYQKVVKRVSEGQLEEEYRKAFQSGSTALYYSSCADPNETWVPLLEKAFAKAHGDYNAIAGGSQGEGIEDLTGGVTSTIVSADVLDTDKFWTEGFLKVNQAFLFGGGTNEYKHPDPQQKGRQGIEDGHAYSVLRVATYGDTRLVLVKNPWGGILEWNGPWSDGSSEWTAESLKALGHTFGDDGIFWMPYKDFLRRFASIWCTRLFGPEWEVTQKWTTVEVPWAGDYNDTKFEITLSKPARTVIVLSKLDDRYFQGLTGQYSVHKFSFRVTKSGKTTHLIRGRNFDYFDRSAHVELDLEPDTYEVQIQVTGIRDSSAPKIEDVVKQNWLNRREKLLRIGLSYDLAHAKGKPKTDDDPTSGDENVVDVKNKKDTIKAAGAVVNEALTSWLRPSKPEEGVRSQAVGGADDSPDETVQETDTAPAPAPVPVPAPAPAAGNAPAADPNDDPWNATCVLGLRVFCQGEGTAATIRVVNTAETKHGKDNAEVKKLDVDDPEKDAMKDKEIVKPASKP